MLAQKKQEMSAYSRLNFQRGITDQPVDSKWAVMYTASATDASACIFHSSSFAQHFLAESTCYISFTQSGEEARFVESYLNSGYANGKIKQFQARGLFGPRHVHKKILELPWPEFSRNQPSHRRLVALGQQAAKQVQLILGSHQDLELDPRTLGRLRISIRKELAGLMAQIDVLVEAISTGKDVLAQSEDWNRLTHTSSAAVKGQSPEELSEFLRSERSRWTERELLSGGSGK